MLKYRNLNQYGQLDDQENPENLLRLFWTHIQEQLKFQINCKNPQIPAYGTTQQSAVEQSAYIEQIDEMGGAVRAIEDGFQKSEIEQSAYELAKAIERKDEIVVGVNEFKLDEEVQPDLQRVDESIRQGQIDRIDAVKADRDQAGVDEALDGLRKAVTGDDSLLPPMRDALKRRATLQEVCDVLRDEWGGYVPRDTF